MTRLGRIKGGTMRSFLAWYEHEVSASRFREIVAALPPEQRQYMQPDRPQLGPLASRWYEAGIIHRVLDDLLDGLTPQQRQDFARRGAEATVKGMRTGVYRVILDWFLTPGRYAKLINAAWRLNYDSGRVVTTKLAENRHRGTVYDWASHHPFLCLFNAAVKRELYAAMGCTGARIIERQCIADGDPHCGSVIEWDS